jgi:RHS repeat-associated protein
MNGYSKISVYKWALSALLLLIFCNNLSAKQFPNEVGNLIKKESINDPDGYRGWRYKWTQGGMLKKVIRPDRKHVDFTYDALGRRLTKTYQEQTTHFVWDGNVPLHEWTASTEESNSTINEKGETEHTTPENLITWIFEDGTFIPPDSYREAKLQGYKSYSIITDHLGTPVESYDEEGKKVWSRELNIYGETRKEFGEENFIPFLYQGQYLDTETELAYNRFRYYSPESGVYVSQDPIGLDGGMPNMYSYVHDLNVWIDPLGLAEMVDPNTLNYSQAYVSGQTETYEQAMKDGTWDWNRRPDTHADPSALRVVEVDGQLVSLDNRRLLAAQNAGLKEVPIVKVGLDDDMPGGGKYRKNLSRKLNSAPKGSGLPKIQLPPTGTSAKPTVVPCK